MGTRAPPLRRNSFGGLEAGYPLSATMYPHKPLRATPEQRADRGRYEQAAQQAMS